MPFVSGLDRTLLCPMVCDTLRRLGSAHDGGYVVPMHAIERAMTLLSFGIGSNWDFERAVARINPRIMVHAYDHTVGRKKFLETAVRSGLSVPLRFLALSPRGTRASFTRFQRAVDYFRFFSGRIRHYQERVWYNADRGSAPITRIISTTGPHAPQSVFVKMDIEGSEYRILPYITDHADVFAGMVIEFHDTDICAGIFNSEVARLRETFDIVHVHGNNHGDLDVDHAHPVSLEVTFLHKRLCFEPAPYVGPLPRPELDAPNDPNNVDYPLDLGQYVEVSRPSL